MNEPAENYHDAYVTMPLAFARALEESDPLAFSLCLYVAGNTPASRQAIENLRAFCTKYLQDIVDLEIVDIQQEPERAREAGLIAAPTLVKRLPPPMRKIIGTLNDTDRLLLGLSLKPR